MIDKSIHVPLLVCLLLLRNRLSYSLPRQLLDDVKSKGRTLELWFEGVVMSLLTLVFASVMIVVHISIFIVESVLWLRPNIYENVVPYMAPSVDVALSTQAKVLELLFLNQGFYNVFLALAALAGICLYKNGRSEAGKILVFYACLSAAGAGVILAFTSQVYSIACLQGIPPFIALLGLCWGYKKQLAAVAS